MSEMINVLGLKDKEEFIILKDGTLDEQSYYDGNNIKRPKVFRFHGQNLQWLNHLDIKWEDERNRFIQNALLTGYYTVEKFKRNSIVTNTLGLRINEPFTIYNDELDIFMFDETNFRFTNDTLEYFDIDKDDWLNFNSNGEYLVNAHLLDICLNLLLGYYTIVKFSKDEIIAPVEENVQPVAIDKTNMINLTKAQAQEITEIRNKIGKHFKWYARDDDGSLWAFTTKPTYKDKCFIDRIGNNKQLTRKSLEFIKAGDYEPVYVGKINIIENPFEEIENKEDKPSLFLKSKFMNVDDNWEDV